jgi:hypothetical protein
VPRAFQVGYNPQDAWEDPAAWGLMAPERGVEGGGRHIWLPRGITFPWYVGGERTRRAAAWWLDVLPRARRWRPVDHDVNSVPDPEEVRLWARRGLDWAVRQGPPVR